MRTAETINKDAILAEPGAVLTVKGISVVAGKETFSVTPFEVEIEQA